MTGRRGLLVGMVMVALLVAGGLSHFASEAPDGLERVAHDLGFVDLERPSPIELMPDYGVPGVQGRASGTLAGLLGTLVVLGLGTGVGLVMQRARSRR